MFLMSSCAGWGRNFWTDVYDGTVDIRSSGRRLHLVVKDGMVVESRERKGSECSTVKYGRELTVSRKGKVVKHVHYEAGSYRAIKKGCLWKRVADMPFCKSKGTLECYSTSSGAYGREIFTYNNGVQAYVASRWRKKLVLRRPNGSLWAVASGRIDLHNWSIAEHLKPDASDLGLSSVMREPNWDLAIYDATGNRIVTQGHVEGYQRQGKWLERGKTVYYVSGVRLSRELYEDDPEKWDGYEVLKIPNAQLRCSLLSRMGYDRLLKKVSCRVIESLEDGGQLVEVDTEAPGGFGGLDNVMRMIKVVCPSTKAQYVLRVPPDIESFEQARQWTFGLRQASITSGARFDLAVET